MNVKKLLIPLLLLLIASQAFAAVTVVVNQPNGQTFFPVTQNQRFMDINFTVVDNNADVSTHTTTIQFNPNTGDANIAVATDLNLSSSNCVFAVSNDWSDPGADCVVRYTFPRTGTILPTASFILDVNAVARTPADGFAIADGQGVNTFGIDNRLVSTNVLAILALSTIILAAIFVISIALFLGNVIDGQMMVFIAIAGIGAVLGIILVSEFLTLLTP